MRPLYSWQLRSRILELGRRTAIMGVLNVTPNSFSDGGLFYAPEQAIKQGLRMLDEGADIVDIGGESTRPGTRVGSGAEITADEELRRVMPVLQGILHRRPDALISIDTYKARVAREAIRAGAGIVNDVSAWQWDPEMAAACRELQCGVILMHTRGRPDEWRNLPHDPDIVATVEHNLADRVQQAFEHHIARERIVLDPGFGFGKNFEENYSLLAGLATLQRLHFPILAGTSRKSFIGRSVGRRTGAEVPAGQRLFGSLAAMVESILRGAHIVRVHDVKPAVEAAAIADDILAAQSSGRSS